MDNLRHHRPGLLLDLIPETKNLEQRGNGVFATFRYLVPTTEFGIPKRQELILGAIAAAGGKRDWDGIHDDHHLAWPQVNYRDTGTTKNIYLGRQYRALKSLRFWGPRQLHEYLHVGFSVPPFPELDVMEQYVHEEEQLRILYSLVQFTQDERDNCFVDAEYEIRRKGRYRAKLDTMQEGNLGHLPELELLYSLSPTDARQEIGRRVRYLTLRDVLRSLDHTEQPQKALTLAD